MPIWQLCANLLIPNCLRSNLSYSPLAALELYVNDTKTEYSFLYHAPKTDRHSRKENKFMGETKQTYHFVVTLQELKQRAEK